MRLQREGIFRVAAQNDHEDWIRVQVNQGEVPHDLDVYALAGLIKVRNALMVMTWTLMLTRQW